MSSSNPLDQGQESFTQIMREAVLPLFLLHPKDGWHWVGSSFVVGYEERQALVFTAGHVLEYVNRLSLPPGLQHPTLICYLAAPPRPPLNWQVPTLYAGVPWHEGFQAAKIITAWSSHDLDFGAAIVSLAPEQPIAFRGRLAIDASPIPMGTQILAVGFSDLTAEVTAEDAPKGTVSYTGTTRLEWRRGVVNEIHPIGTTISPWPGFSVDCPFSPGMSGGPIIEVPAGEENSIPITVRGMIGADMSGPSERPFASMLWPALATEAHVAIEGEADPLTLLDLVRRGYIKECGGALEHLRVAKPEDGVTIIRWEP